MILKGLGQLLINTQGQKKSHPRVALKKSPRRRRWNLLKPDLLGAWASILVNCDSSWLQLYGVWSAHGIPHSGEFAIFLFGKR